MFGANYGLAFADYMFGANYGSERSNNRAVRTMDPSFAQLLVDSTMPNMTHLLLWMMFKSKTLASSVYLAATGTSYHGNEYQFLITLSELFLCNYSCFIPISAPPHLYHTLPPSCHSPLNYLVIHDDGLLFHEVHILCFINIVTVSPYLLAQMQFQLCKPLNKKIHQAG